MFESIAILPHSQTHPLNIGELAEKMLYYKKVHLYVNTEDLKTLFAYFDIDILIEYLERGYLRLVNRKKAYGVVFQDESYIADFMYNVNYDLKEVLYNAYFEYSKDEQKSRKAANKLYRYVGVFDIPDKFANEINADLLDNSFLKQAIQKQIEYYRPHDKILIDELRFNVEVRSDGRLNIESNIDIQNYPFLDPSSIVLNIGTAIENIKIACSNSSELSIPLLNSKIIAVKVNSLITTATKSAKDIEMFQYAEFPNSPSLHAIINDRHRSMREFLQVLKEGEKFKDWLTGLGEGNKIVQEYIAKMNEKSWLQSVPSKAGRFYLVQGISTILKATGTLEGIAAGIGLSAANTFLVEKLLKGWKPNHFIEETVKPFIQVAEAAQEANK